MAIKLQHMFAMFFPDRAFEIHDVNVYYGRNSTLCSVICMAAGRAMRAGSYDFGYKSHLHAVVTQHVLNIFNRYVTSHKRHECL